MSRVHITFPSDYFILEGCWHIPESAGPFPAVIVCHPHSLYGGSMSNNVIFETCQALAQRSIAALRFNFRGVGKSGGRYGGGIDEQEDARAALALTSSTPDIDTEKVGLAGYSFGASVALPVAVQNTEVGLLALVSPALTESAWEQLRTYSQPVFVISGEDDHLIPPEKIREHLGNTPETKQYEIIAGADHFWQGYEAKVVEKVADYFAAGFA
ncbi:alpha/beta hydrolase [Chloroflexota bacterium]